jgi:uncharacterized membrane protein
MTFWKSAKPEPAAVLFTVFSVLYPVIAVISVHTVGPLPVVATLCGMYLLRLVAPGSKKMPGHMTLALLAAVAGVAVVAVIDGDLSVRLYPVFMSAVMFVAFASTLLHPPSMIERFALITEPSLPPHAVVYTRIVTMVWAGFFLVNGAVALWTAVAGSWAVWTLYNGCIVYVLMGVLLVIEYLVRRKVRGHEARA